MANPAQNRPVIRAIAFDAYGTLFDVLSVGALAEQLFPGKGSDLANLWRVKQIDYTRLRTLSDRYRDFYEVTRDALRMAARSLALELDAGSEQRLMNQYACLAAFPENLDNPVHRLAPLLDELVTLQWDTGDDEFPASHCQVAAIRGGSGARNVTPAFVELLVNFRNGPGSPFDHIRDRFERLLKRHGIDDYEADWAVMGDPFRSPPGKLRGAVIEAVESLLGVTPELNTGGGTSDGRYIAPLGTEVLELGLLNTTIHQVNERTPVADLDRLYATYYDILRRVAL